MTKEEYHKHCRTIAHFIIQNKKKLLKMLKAAKRKKEKKDEKDN